MTPNLHDNFNSHFFGQTAGRTDSQVLEEIVKAQEALQNLIKEYQRQKSGNTGLFSQEMLVNLERSLPDSTFLMTNTDEIVMSVYPLYLNYLYAPRQDSARNSAVFFKSRTPYNMRIGISKTRALSFHNNTNLRDFMIHRVLYVETGFRERTGESELPLSMSLSNTTPVHPHATGSNKNFSSVCTGNNPWRNEVQNARTALDILVMFNNMYKWVTSANVHDMYDSPISDVIAQLIPHDKEQESKDFIISFCKQLFHYMPPIYSMNPDNRFDAMQNTLEAITEERRDEINDLLVVKELTTNKPMFNLYMSPFIKKSNEYDFSAIYAALLLTNQQLHVYKRNCLLNDLIFGIIQPNSSLANDVLAMPLALYDLNNLSSTSDFAFLDFEKNN